MPKWIKPAAAILLLLYMVVQILSVRVQETRPASRVDRFIVYVSAPVQGLLSGFVRSTVDLWQRYIYLTQTVRVNEQLNHERNNLLQQVQQLKEIQEENRRLRTLLEIPFKEGLHLITGERIALLGASPYEHMIRIQRGERDGVERGQAVLNASGVVGQVVKVENSVCDVMLLANQFSAIDGINQRSRGRGILKGGGFTNLKFDYLSPKDDIQIGDEIVTSGLDGVYPKGIPIGTVMKINPVGKALYTFADVKPAVDFSKIEEVMIVIGKGN